MPEKLSAWLLPGGFWPGDAGRPLFEQLAAMQLSGPWLADTRVLCDAEKIEEYFILSGNTMEYRTWEKE